VSFASWRFRELGLDYRDYVRTDERFFRPLEVEALIGDATKAHTVLGWKPTYTFSELVSEMVRAISKQRWVNPKLWTHAKKALEASPKGCRVLTRIRNMRILYDGGIVQDQSVGGINRYFANLIRRLPQTLNLTSRRVGALLNSNPGTRVCVFIAFPRFRPQRVSVKLEKLFFGRAQDSR
jgi:hypothetical protein